MNRGRLPAKGIKSRGRHLRLDYELAVPQSGVRPGRAGKSQSGVRPGRAGESRRGARVSSLAIMEISVLPARMIQDCKTSLEDPKAEWRPK
jgi:hypothetical protein